MSVKRGNPSKNIAPWPLKATACAEPLVDDKNRDLVKYSAEQIADNRKQWAQGDPRWTSPVDWRLYCVAVFKPTMAGWQLDYIAATSTTYAASLEYCCRYSTLWGYPFNPQLARVLVLRMPFWTHWKEIDWSRE